MSQSESNWDKFKKKVAPEGAARPWHVLNPGKHIDQETAQARLDICGQCDRLISVTKQCRECGCIMPMKTRLIGATCPLGKW